MKSEIGVLEMKKMDSQKDGLMHVDPRSWFPGRTRSSSLRDANHIDSAN